MPVSDATLSTSPTKAAVTSRDWLPFARSPCIGMWTWPSSPAIPAAPRMMRPASISPPPRPVPTIAETEEPVPPPGRSARDGRRAPPRCRRCCRSREPRGDARARRGTRTRAMAVGRSSSLPWKRSHHPRSRGPASQDRRREPTPWHACEAEHVVEGPDESPDCRIRPVEDTAGALDQPVHQEPPRAVEHCRAVARAARCQGLRRPMSWRSPLTPSLFASVRHAGTS